MYWLINQEMNPYFIQAFSRNTATVKVQNSSKGSDPPAPGPVYADDSKVPVRLSSLVPCAYYGSNYYI